MAASKMSPYSRPRRAAGDPLVVAILAAIALSVFSLYQLRNFPFPGDLHSAYEAIAMLAPVTAVTALKVWAFWGWSALLIATLMRRLDRQIEALDSWLIGIVGAWAAAYFLGMLLGPLGLFRAATLWLVNLTGTVWLWRDFERPRLQRPSFATGLVLLAIALAAVSLIPLQLASPVVPYMDVLSWPASAQRVMTFGVYRPFNNDPYGIWGPNVQQPALELFYAYLALGSHTPLAVLAESALIFPIAALSLLAVYRLGVALFGELAGGAAALLVFLTNLLRWVEGMRGTAVDFVLIALGLALFLDSRRNRALMASGALMLGVALPSHAIDGALGVGVAAAACLSWMLERDASRFGAGAFCLAGALLVGSPEILIARAITVPAAALVVPAILRRRVDHRRQLVSASADGCARSARRNLPGPTAVADRHGGGSPRYRNTRRLGVRGSTDQLHDARGSCGAGVDRHIGNTPRRRCDHAPGHGRGDALACPGDYPCAQRSPARQQPRDRVRKGGAKP
jgi:hypothetical protein